MKKILFLLSAVVCVFAACDPTHEDISNAGHITADELKANTIVKVDQEGGKFGNVVTCETSAPVNAVWNIGGKDYIGNYAWKKMKVDRDDNGNYKDTPYTIVLTALCADGTELKAEFPVTCQTVTNPLEKFYIYGDPAKAAEEPPFQPGAWQSADMRFSSTEGAHLPTIPDDVYFGLKTLIVDVSDANDPVLMIHNGWWSATYYDNVSFVNGPNEIQITEEIAKTCAKGGEGKDLQLLLKSGSFTLNSVYYEE